MALPGKRGKGDGIRKKKAVKGKGAQWLFKEEYLCRKKRVGAFVT